MEGQPFGMNVKTDDVPLVFHVAPGLADGLGVFFYPLGVYFYPFGTWVFIFTLRVGVYFYPCGCLCLRLPFFFFCFFTLGVFIFILMVFIITLRVFIFTLGYYLLPSGYLILPLGYLFLPFRFCPRRPSLAQARAAGVGAGVGEVPGFWV